MSANMAYPCVVLDFRIWGGIPEIYLMVRPVRNSFDSNAIVLFDLKFLRIKLRYGQREFVLHCSKDLLF